MPPSDCTGFEAFRITGLFVDKSNEKNVLNVIIVLQKIPLHILKMIILVDLLNLLQFYVFCCKPDCRLLGLGSVSLHR